LVAGSYGNNTQYLYTSVNSGATWSEQRGPGLGAWQSVASSSDGSKLVAVASSGTTFSTDFGKTWTAPRFIVGTNDNTLWEESASVASSGDGAKLVMVGGTSGPIHTSTDSGVTWVQRASGLKAWSSVTISDDGTKMSAVGGNVIFVSSDSGVTWTDTKLTASWRQVAASADGTKLVAAAYGGLLYQSVNAGATWKSLPPVARNWTSVTSSADGTKLMAGVANGYIYSSIDAGVSWTEHTDSGLRNWTALASSASGAISVAGSNGGPLYSLTYGR
jgi:hypothetical protein